MVDNNWTKQKDYMYNDKWSFSCLIVTCFNIDSTMCVGCK